MADFEVARFAGSGIRIFRAHAAAGPRDHQGCRNRDRDLARYRQGGRCPLDRDQPHGQRLRAR